MITAFSAQERSIAEQTLKKDDPLPGNLLWIDAFNPSEDARHCIAEQLGLELPDPAGMHDIEISSRLYKKGKAVYLTLNVMVGFETPEPYLDSILIVIAPGCLVTLRYSEPYAIGLFKKRIMAQPDMFATKEDGLLALLDALSDRIADILESVSRTVDDLSRQTFPRTQSIKHAATSSARMASKHRERRLNVILQGIGQAGDINHKIGASISGLMRLNSFLEPYASAHFGTDQISKFHLLVRDTNSLNEQAQMIATEISFLLDATLGQINIEQNNIIKIFSVVMVAFTPPTFFASLWGMNFHDMPEYAMPWGYGIALCVMAVSAIIPMWYFARRGWLS